MPGSNVRHCGGVYLRDTRLYDVKDDADLIHGQLFVVVQSQNHALALGEVADCFGLHSNERRVRGGSCPNSAPTDLQNSSTDFRGTLMTEASQSTM
jgi:hypothetical protein